MKKISILLSLSLFTLAACKSYTPFLYKHDNIQGTVLSDEQIAAIQNGMTRNQVHLILGTPSITDPFHPNTDVYIFMMTSGETDHTYRKSVTINYENDIVINKIDTPVLIEK